MCFRPDGRNCSVYKEPDADHACLALSARGRSPGLSGQSKTTLVQRPGTAARIATTGRCGRLEDNLDATTLPRQCKCKTNYISVLFFFAPRHQRDQYRHSGEDELIGPKDVKKILAEKRASQRRPQGNVHLDCSSRVGSPRLPRNPPPYFKVLRYRPTSSFEQLGNHTVQLDFIEVMNDARWPSTTFYKPPGVGIWLSVEH